MGGVGSGPRPAPAEVRRAKGRSAGRDSGGRKIPEPGEVPPALAVLSGGADRTPDLPSTLREDGPGAARWVRAWRDAAWLHTEYDHDAVLRLCEAEDARELMRDDVEDRGVMIPGSMGQLRAHPLLAQLRALEAAMLTLERELGLTPASRTGLGVGERQGEATSALQQILELNAARQSRRA